MTALFVNPTLSIAPLDAACAQPSALCTVDSSAGLRRYAIPLPVVEFVRCFEDSNSVEAAIGSFRSNRGDDWTEVRLRSLIASVLLPRGILLDALPDGVPTTRSDSAGMKGFLTLRVPLLRGRNLEAAASALSWLFRPTAVAIAIPFVIALQALFFLEIAPNHDLSLDRLHSGSILALMLLSTISTLTHEFGHVAAAARFRCKNLEIGWGLYLIFTVMYSDVSEAWGLSRRQRMVVDFGGVYVQSISLAGFLIGYALTHWNIWLIGFLFSTGTIIASANPILRLDGYWIVSDYFGIVNLRAMSLAWARSFVERHVLRRPTRSVAPPLSRQAMAVVGTYCALTVVFMFYVAVFVLDHVLRDVVLNYPDRVVEFWKQVGHAPDRLSIVQLSFELLWRSMVVIGVASFVIRYARIALRMAGRAFPRTTTNPLEATYNAG